MPTKGRCTVGGMQLSWSLPTDLAPKIRVGGKEKCPDPFGRAFATRLDGPLLRCAPRRILLTFVCQANL